MDDGVHGYTGGAVAARPTPAMRSWRLRLQKLPGRRRDRRHQPAAVLCGRRHCGLQSA
ncbi:MAG: hypothetical protein ACLU9S_22705 [Oscillospiraceae bacterium]